MMKLQSILVVVGVLLAGAVGFVACGGSVDKASSGEQASTAKKPGSLGGICGGLAGIRCASGLTCSAAKSNVSDASGTCVEERDASGDLCFNPHDCDDGFLCKDGRCVPDTSGVGDLCFNPHDCDPPLVCKDGRCAR